MINFDDIILFDNKRFSDVLKDIYIGSTTKTVTIQNFLQQLNKLVTNSNDAILIIPLIRDYLETSVRNDEQLIKLAAVVQRFFSGGNRQNSPSETTSLLTDQEKAELLKMAQSTIDNSIDNNLKKLESEYEKFSK